MCYTQQQGNGLNCRADSGVHTGMMLKLDTSRDILIVERRGFFSLFQSSGYIAPIRLGLTLRLSINNRVIELIAYVLQPDCPMWWKSFPVIRPMPRLNPQNDGS